MSIGVAINNTVTFDLLSNNTADKVAVAADIADKIAVGIIYKNHAK